MANRRVTVLECDECGVFFMNEEDPAKNVKQAREQAAQYGWIRITFYGVGMVDRCGDHR